MNRRSFLLSSAGATALTVVPRLAVAQTATPGAAPFPTLDIVVHDDGYELPAKIAAGRTLVTVTNKGTQGSHTSLGILPASVTRDAVQADLDKMTDPKSSQDYTPSWFWTTTWVGMPDWPKPGASVTGIVDLKPGLAIVLNPIGEQMPSLVEITGEFGTAPEPAADAAVLLADMTIKLPDAGLKRGGQRVKVENKGGVEHEFAVLPLPAGVTKEQLIALFMMPADATPTPGQPNIAYAPIDACSILSEGSASWIDMDLPTGHYAALCMLPDQTTGVPHAMMGMLDIFDVQ